MRRFVIVLAALMVVGALGMPATAAKKKKPPKPVKTTLYMHGTQPFSELEDGFALGGSFMKMDTKAPADPAPKSAPLSDYVVSPNTACAGNTLFPVWSGALSGTIKGNVTVKFWMAGTPGQLDVRIWPDVNSLLCDSGLAGSEDYPEPAGELRILALPGENTVVLKKVNMKALTNFMVQLTPVIAGNEEPSPDVLPPVEGRALYDSPSTATQVTFLCTPRKGRKCA